MNNDDRPFQAEQIYEQIELLGSTEHRQAPPSSDARLISNLRQVYTQDREIVEQVWKKLSAQAHAEAPAEEQQAQQAQTEMQPMKQRAIVKRPRGFLPRLLELGAALVVVGALVIGLVIVLQRVNPSPGPIGRATVVPLPARSPQGGTPTAMATATQPPCGVTHPLQLPAPSGPTAPAVFYLVGQGGYQTSPSHTSLMRYDLVTGQTTTLVQATSQASLSGVRLSPDKQWLLLQESTGPQQHLVLQVMRTNGSQLQTVYESCSSNGGFGNTGVWSPDGHRVAFIDPITGISVLDLASGKLQRFLQSTGVTSYTPAFWADNQRLLITHLEGTTTVQTVVELLDTSKGEQQTPGDLKPITSLPSFCGTIAPGDNGSQLFSSSCTVAPGNCQGDQVQGPSTIGVLPATGGAARTIYSSPSRAVTAIASANPSSLLIYIENTTGDLSQDGLWQIKTDGSGLQRLTTTAHAQPCQYSQQSPYPLTQLSSNGASYALLCMDAGEQKLIVGSLSGGTPKTLLAHQIANINVLLLVGVG